MAKLEIKGWTIFGIARAMKKSPSTAQGYSRGQRSAPKSLLKLLEKDPE